MDLALFISEPRDLEAIPATIGGIPVSRIYFGNEFCERLLMVEQQLDRAIDAASTRGIGLSIVFPYVSQKPFERAARLLDRLAARAPRVEVVCNDWGVLRAAARESALVPVMGRCLNRTPADPRLPEHVGDAMPRAALAWLRSGAFDSSAFAAFAERFRIARVELDEPPLGFEPVKLPVGVSASVHHPWMFVASGRICLSAALGRGGAAVGDRFSPGHCRYECRQYEHDLAAPAGVAGRLPIIQRGNTIFTRHGGTPAAERLLSAIDRLSAYGDRLVWAAAAPMGGGPCA